MATKVGIIGLGFVGSAVEHWFEKVRPEVKGKDEEEVELFRFDKYKEIGSVEEVNQADIIFVAVPTPYYFQPTVPADGSEPVQGYDDSAVRDALSNIEGGKTVVIKSTVRPGSTEDYQIHHPDKTIPFNPEFLVERRAKEDFINPDRQIVGVSSRESKEAAEKILNLLPEASYSEIISSREAEMVKFVNNAFLALKVTFGVEINELCEKLSVDYDTVIKWVARDSRINYGHLEASHGNMPGFGGKCLPKDLNILLELAKAYGVYLKLLDTVWTINVELRLNYEYSDIE